MRILFFSTLAAFVAIFTLPAIAQAEMNAPQIYAVAHHADWCGACKVLGPKFMDARKNGNLAEQDVLFVKYDLTNEATTHQSALMAAALGLGEKFKANDGKTGYIALINAESKEEIGRLTQDMESAEMIKKVTMALQ